MRLVIQTVNRASVTIDHVQHATINQGLLCFVGFCDSDATDDFEWAINKVINLKLFKHKTSLQEIGGELLIVSQFTLFASIKKGTKPSWSKAANPALAKEMYSQFIDICNSKMFRKVQTGVFGANMQVESINDGPITITIDTKKRE